jgi:hypothetical protein
MKKELDEQLCKDFPLIFRDRQAPMNESCMHWGFPGDGWYNIIREICEEMVLVKKLTGIQYTADQVKEKFGTLRFYFSDDNRPTKLTELERIKWMRYIWRFVAERENKSDQICEVCGNTGILHNDQWHTITLCNECKVKRDEASK